MTNRQLLFLEMLTFFERFDVGFAGIFLGCELYQLIFHQTLDLPQNFWNLQGTFFLLILGLVMVILAVISPINLHYMKPDSESEKLPYA